MTDRKLRRLAKRPTECSALQREVIARRFVGEIDVDAWFEQLGPDRYAPLVPFIGLPYDRGFVADLNSHVAELEPSALLAWDYQLVRSALGEDMFVAALTEWFTRRGHKRPADVATWAWRASEVVHLTPYTLREFGDALDIADHVTRHLSPLPPPSA